MKAPDFHHVTGVEVWRHCDHQNTWLHEPTATVRLSPRAELGQEPGAPVPASQLSPSERKRVLGAWIKARGGAACYPCPPDRCAEGVTLLADPGGELLVLHDGRWMPIGGRDEPSITTPPLRFGAAGRTAKQPPFANPGGLARDPFGRFWLLERAAARIRLLAADDLRILDTIPTPVSAEVIHIATASWGVVAADRTGRRLWRQMYGGEWEPVMVPPVRGGGEPEPTIESFEPVAVAGDSAGDAVAILRPRSPRSKRPSLLVVIEREDARYGEIETLNDPLPVVMLPDGYLLIGDIERLPNESGVVVFSRFKLADGRLVFQDQWGVRGFDGRALFVDDDGRPFATTAHGVHALFPRQAPLATEGRIETFALDSEQYGCVWHRVFLDGCLPAGTAVEIEARTSDDLPPESLRRDPRPPFGRIALDDTNQDDGTANDREAVEDASKKAVREAWNKLPLGSRTPGDVEGWIPLGMLDRRIAMADIPVPPGRGERPSEDAYPPRAPVPEPISFDTLEGLIKNPPGRFLWLRVHLRGTARRSPAVLALRATYPRPSILELLPAFWRADARMAVPMDHALSLFESFYTEVDQRISAFRHVLDPRITPPEAIEWLATFVALTFDSRVDEPVRRQLLSEATRLYRMRGTVPGLERLCAILARCRVAVIEAFRVRRRSAAFLDASGGDGVDIERGVLGPGLQLGGTDGADDGIAAPEAWESALPQAHERLMDRRTAQRAAGAIPCPDEDPPDPLDPDPFVSFHRRYAHRFSVLLFRARDGDVEAVIEAAVESAKPAHTLHRLCWLDAGFRLGTNAYVGIGTRTTGVDRLQPALLGESPLGIDRTISFGPPGAAPGTFVGAAQVGKHTNLG